MRSRPSAGRSAIRRSPQWRSASPVQWQEAAMRELNELFDRSARLAGSIAGWSTQTARLMIGVPDYDTYVAHRRANHPSEPIMSYVEFFRERQQARYAVGNGRFRGCC